MKRVAAAVLALGAATISAAEKEWTAAESDNFELVTTGGQRKAKSAIQHFEEVRDFFVKALKFDPKLKSKVRLIAFDSDGEWKRYRPNEVAIAFYLSGADRDTIAMESLRGEVYPVAVHEYVHLLLRHSGGTFPVWLNEGLAELYSSMNSMGGRMRVGDLHMGRYQLLQQTKWLNMEDLVNVDHNSPIYNTKGHAGIFYSQSWALVHMLVLGDQYRPRSPELINLIAFKEVPSAKAFQDVYGKTLQQVQQDLRAYLNSNSIKVFVFDYKPEKPLMPAVRPATKFEGDLAAARLLARNQDSQEADQIFERLEKENPSDLSLAEAYGFHLLYRRKMDEARPRLERAIAAGSGNAKVYMQHAFLAQRQDAAKAVASMKRATELEPGDRELRYYLARMLLQARKPGEALSALMSARPAPPEHQVGYLCALAEIYVQFKKPEDARVAVNRALQLAKSDRDVAMSNSIQQYVAQSELYLQQQKEHAEQQRLAEERYKKYLEERAKAEAQPAGNTTTSETVVENDPLEKRIQLKGKLQAIECKDGQPVVHIVSASAAKARRFLIDDPRMMSMTARDGKSLEEFTCGPQGNAAVTLTFIPSPDAKTATEGLVRVVEFE